MNKCSSSWKALVSYYIQIFLPFGLIFTAYNYLNLSRWFFLTLFALYIIPYRPIIDTNRLIHKGIIEDRGLYKKLTYGLSHTAKHFKELYFK